MRKNLMTLAATAAFAVTLFSSCATINSGAALTEKAPIGSKTGEAKSYYFLGLWSSNGLLNNIKQAAENGGIKKVAQVEYVDQSVLGGLFIMHTTRVYGE